MKIIIFLWWLIYTISCFRVFAPKGERRRHENMSFCRYFEAKTRRHDKQRATTRKISTRQHEIFNKEIFVPSPVKMSLFRLACFVFSCLRPESRKSLTTKRHVFVSPPYNHDGHNGILVKESNIF